MGKERGVSMRRSNGRQLALAEKIREELGAPEPSFSAHKADGERIPVLDGATGLTLWSSVDPRFSKK